MDLILFTHQDSFKKGVTLKKILDQNLKGVVIKNLQTFNSFKARLKQVSNYNKEIFILLAESKKRLNELTSLIDLMEDKRIILVLSDDSKATVSIAHKFSPRYFTYVNDTYVDLCDVLVKMIRQKNKY